MSWVLDLDGVLWRGAVDLPGAADAVARLRAAGERVVFLTNNSEPDVAWFVARLGRAGVEATAADLLTSAQAAAHLVTPGERVLAAAGPGVVEALLARGVTLVEEGPCDAVVVGRHRTFDFDVLTRAAKAIHGGARLIGTNIDPTYPTPDGLEPGNGALLAAVATAGLTTPIVAGKPEQPMADLVRARVDDVEVVVGDQPLTDGRLAEQLGVDFLLVLTGVTTEADLPVAPTPALVAADLAAAVAARLGRP